MATVTATWYIRLPNGRLLRARSADAVRRQLRAGRIPPGTRARRIGEGRWQAIERIAEFADMDRVTRTAANGAPHPAPAARDAAPAPAVRGVIDELLLAYDHTLRRAKLAIAALAGIGLAVGLIVLTWAAALPAGAESIAGYAGAGGFMLAVTALASALLTRMTVIELDQQRPAAAAGIVRSFLRILIAQAIVAGVALGLLFAVQAAGPWLAAGDWGDLAWLAMDWPPCSPWCGCCWQPDAGSPSPLRRSCWVRWWSSRKNRSGAAFAAGSACCAATLDGFTSTRRWCWSCARARATAPAAGRQRGVCPRRPDGRRRMARGRGVGGPGADAVDRVSAGGECIRLHQSALRLLPVGTAALTFSRDAAAERGACPALRYRVAAKRNTSPTAILRSARDLRGCAQVKKTGSASPPRRARRSGESRGPGSGTSAACGRCPGSAGWWR